LIDYGAGEAQYKRQFSTGTLRMGRAVWSAANARSLLARAWQSVEWRLRTQYKHKSEPS
jgi:CelD/BcsL family acetyltransferase involved in cellulose biosynthesis